jgi:hypothetical protein
MQIKIFLETKFCLYTHELFLLTYRASLNYEDIRRDISAVPHRFLSLGRLTPHPFSRNMVYRSGATKFNLRRAKYDNYSRQTEILEQGPTANALSICSTLVTCVSVILMIKMLTWSNS